jgi:hypothetical protein
MLGKETSSWAGCRDISSEKWVPEGDRGGDGNSVSRGEEYAGLRNGLLQGVSLVNYGGMLCL